MKVMMWRSIIPAIHPTRYGPLVAEDNHSNLKCYSFSFFPLAIIACREFPFDRSVTLFQWSSVRLPAPTALLRGILVAH